MNTINDQSSMTTSELHSSVKRPTLRPILFATVCTLSSMLVIGCQKADDTQDTKVTDSNPPATTQSAAVPKEVPVVESSSPSDAPSTPEPGKNDTEVEVVDADTLIANDTAAQPTTPPPGPDPEVAIIGTQISNVDYKNSAGGVLKVIYETAPKGELKATVTLPSGKKVTLNAPAAQGNNPTYRSADGNIELVSHEGGGAVDLLENGKPVSFNAVNAEAEVIPQ